MWCDSSAGVNTVEIDSHINKYLNSWYDWVTEKIGGQKGQTMQISESGGCAILENNILQLRKPDLRLCFLTKKKKELLLEIKFHPAIQGQAGLCVRQVKKISKTYITHFHLVFLRLTNSRKMPTLL